MREVPVQKRFALGWYNEGVASMDIREYEEAMTFFERALSTIPDHPDFLIGKGDVMFATGRYQEAYEIFLQALTYEPDNLRAILRAGTTLLEMEKYEGALHIFEKGLRINEYDGEFWLGLGIAQFHLGRIEEALTALKRAMRYKPNQPSLWYYLSMLETSDEGAVRMLLRGYRLDSTNLAILIAITERLLSMGRIEEAVEFCRRALAIDSKNAEIQHLAQRCLQHER
jgi:tetratricopeptide (TPR) repeat protein